MAQLAIKGHNTRGNEVIKLLEMLGGKNDSYPCSGEFINNIYYINDYGYINSCHKTEHSDYLQLTLEEFEDKFPYKIGDRVLIPEYESEVRIDRMIWDGYEILYSVFIDEVEWYSAGELNDFNDMFITMEDKEETMEEQDNNVSFSKEDKGNISDGYHTFNELYEYRLLYNAGMFNELAKQGLYDVHKSRRHSDGSIPFNDDNWFIVQAELPTGQISNHYEMKDWDLFDIPIKDKANPYDGHTSQDVIERIRKFLKK